MVYSVYLLNTTTYVKVVKMIRKLTSLDTYIIRIERGQFLKQSIESLAQEQHWSSARITAGIGAVNNIDIAYFDTAIKSYQRQVFADNAELISLEGNITLKENKPFIHWHACLSNTDYQSFG